MFASVEQTHYDAAPQDTGKPCIINNKDEKISQESVRRLFCFYVEAVEVFCVSQVEPAAGDDRMRPARTGSCNGYASFDLHAVGRQRRKLPENS
jgi:hypothetical protein